MKPLTFLAGPYSREVGNKAHHGGSYLSSSQSFHVMHVAYPMQFSVDVAKAHRCVAS